MATALKSEPGAGPNGPEVGASGGKNGGPGSNQNGSRSDRSFILTLLALALTLILLGVGAFVYLRSGSPLSLLLGGDRPIAAATTLVPARSPFTISLLTGPERLIALQQALADAEQRQAARDEIAQLKKTLFDATGLDYDGDLLPWMGEEITFAYTDSDLDSDRTNGQQPGYLVLVEIAPERLTQAKQFLQSFWQQRSLSGDIPTSQQLNGVRILSSQRQSASLTSATALVGSQFVIFANDVRAVKQSVHTAQIGETLAQNKHYRTAAEQLPKDRIALAYLDPAALSPSTAETPAAPAAAKRTAVSLGLTNTGLVTSTYLGETTHSQSTTDISSDISMDLLGYLPAASQLALVSDHLSELPAMLENAGLSVDILPEFLRLGETTQSEIGSPWDWAEGDYAIANLGSNNRDNSNWVAIVNRDETGITQLDQATTAQGYSSVPIAIADRQATAWTRFKASNQRRSSTSGLETELLGLHLQQDSYEIFAGSLAAMDSVLAATQSSLAGTPRFERAIAPLPKPDEGFIYLDWPAIAPSLSKTLPVFNLIQIAARPLLTHIDTLALARDDNTVSAFIQLRESQQRYGTPRRQTRR